MTDATAGGLSMFPSPGAAVTSIPHVCRREFQRCHGIQRKSCPQNDGFEELSHQLCLFEPHNTCETVPVCAAVSSRQKEIPPFGIINLQWMSLFW